MPSGEADVPGGGQLKRLALGPLRLDLPLGQVRPLRAEEEQALYEAVGLSY
ncbi:MAG: hypothetical protein ACUVS9_05170 [Thermaceae bacterium]